ncbi:hypothetical protein YPPY47_1415, partial [Yersinia pestis PY-47]
MNGHQR